MIDWQKTASAVIDGVHRTLPADADLKSRQKALRNAFPWEFGATSWGRKVRAKYTRAYLEKYGLPKLNPQPASEHLSPLDRMIARAKAAEQAKGTPT